MTNKLIERTNLEILETWHKENKIVELPVIANIKDRKSPVFLIGETPIYPHVAWNPPVGTVRKITLKKTKSGRFFCIPADLGQLQENEYSTTNIRFFRIRLKKNRGQFIGFLESGITVLLANQETWKNAGADQFVGRIIEVNALPRSICFVAWPAHGFDNIGCSTQLSTATYEKEGLERAIAMEKKDGLIRILVNGKEQSIPAVLILGIAPDEFFDKTIIANKYRGVRQKYSPDNANSKPIPIPQLNPHEFLAKADEARKILEALVENGTNRFIDPEICDDGIENTPAVAKALDALSAAENQPLVPNPKTRNRKSAQPQPKTDEKTKKQKTSKKRNE